MTKKLLPLIVLCWLGTLVVPAAADEPVIRGYLLFETWQGITGSTVADLTSNPAFPDNPTSAEWRESLEIESNRADNYAVRASGYILPPETGNYTFWIACDDAGELWLGTDDDWANCVKIASVPTWASERQWNKYPEQQSVEIPLVAGQKYCVDVLYKENAGGDNLAVAWIGPGIGSDPCNPVVIQGEYLSPYIRPNDRDLILKYYKARVPSPADGSYVGTTDITLTWDPVIYAASHHVYLGEDLSDVNNGTGGTDKGSVTQPAFSGYPFQLGKTYYWRVDEVEADGVTVYPGNVWSFTVSLLTASVPTPPDGSKFVDPNVTLGWVAGAGAVSHEVYLGSDQTQVSNGDSAVFKGSQTATSYSPGTLPLGIKHYWRIDEVEADGTTRHQGPVWSFTTLPAMTIGDPNLMGWWKLDESQGNYAFDYSGHGNRGTLYGGPVWTLGHDGGALDFDGKDDYVDTGKMPSALGVGGNAPRTVSVWVYTRAFTSGGGVYWMGPNRAGEQFALTTRPTTDMWRMQYWNMDRDFTVTSLNQWVHFTHIHDGTRSKIYANGTVVVDEERTLNTTDGQTFVFGTYRTNRFNGLIDDLRLYSRAVSEAEVPRIMAGDPALAWNPKPTDGSTPDIRQAAALSWAAGDNAAQHDVFFGTDQAAVAAANATNTTGIYRGRQALTNTTYTLPEALQWGQTCYWRIDEVTADGSVNEGKVWSFTVASYLVVDDFESYTDDDGSRIYQTWIDGYGTTTNGSQVGNFVEPFAEKTIVHGGSQSMPLYYNNNNGIASSSATRTFDSVEDWTQGGLKLLTLCFYGAVTNVNESMWVSLADKSNRSGSVTYGAAAGENAADITVASWHVWNIPLAGFGVDLKGVKAVTIGFGSPGGASSGTSGLVIFDDIRVGVEAAVP